MEERYVCSFVQGFRGFFAYKRFAVQGTVQRVTQEIVSDLVSQQSTTLTVYAQNPVRGSFLSRNEFRVSVRALEPDFLHFYAGQTLRIEAVSEINFSLLLRRDSVEQPTRLKELPEADAQLYLAAIRHPEPARILSAAEGDRTIFRDVARMDRLARATTIPWSDVKRPYGVRELT